MIKNTDDKRYAYVIGIIRAREARLLTKNHFDRLISSPMSSFSSILADSAYGGDEITAGFMREESQIEAFIKKFSQHQELVDFIDWPQQIHNLKVNLKLGSEDMLYEQSSSEIETWPEIVEEVARFSLEKDLFVLSTNLDKILCKYLYERAEPLDFFNKYFRLYFDLENIRSFFRARQLDNAQHIFNQVFIEFGSLGSDIFLDNISSSSEVLGKSFFTTRYYGIMDRGGVYLKQHNSFLRLERMCDEMRLNFLAQARKMTFGIEPLFSYYEFKLAEIKKLRQVYWGKLNEVLIDDLRESLPDVW